ncbi:MAG: DNA polymerase III subunit delta' C-terminal domain-containing protein [Candidatus Hinthialibacter antarcticus]|nr:DNA polymerase III subunit delta' C-terminal domain-containing protein [Candidatus Hinthialibacter antarcticus]
MPWADAPCRETVRKMIVRSSEKDMLSGSHLIYGPPGAGQYEVGRALAMTLLCPEVENDFCGACSVCQRILAKTHPDYIELRPEDDWEKPERKGRDYSVGHMRLVMEFARLEPHEGERKIFLAHDAHRMTIAAANSLLKLLEEPHARLLFILLSDNESAVLPTIRSRCRRIRLAPLEAQGLIDRLEGVSKSEAETIARAAGGLPEKAQSLIEGEYLQERDEILKILQSVLKHEAAVTEAADWLAKDRERMRDRLHILAGLLRDASLAACGADGPYVNPDRLDVIQKESKAASPEGWMIKAESVLDSIEGLDRNWNPSLLFAKLFLEIRNG